MIASVLNTATPVEVVWTVCTVLGLAANLWGLTDAWLDRQFLRDSGLNGRRKIVARWHVVLNAGLTYVQIAFLTAGAVALFTPSAPTSSLRTARTLVQLALLSAEPVLVYIAIEARRYRARMLASRNLRSLVQLGPGEDIDGEN